ncbi:MAG: hypothetical protein WCP87_00445 [Atribacterota bacterium]
MEKKWFGVIAVLVLVLVLVMGVVLAAEKGSTSQSGKSGYKLTGKLVLLSGMISKIDLKSTTASMVVSLSNGKTVYVELGPFDFFKPTDFVLGFVISFMGEYVESGKKQIYIPYHYDTAGKKFVLRDKNGVPKWMKKK